ncbi:LOB domain-containing protein 14-like [Pyrus ussuriensis x Pyrus communis]|uniref:LOB domain-containing protein 14-like n=1 Tax=Pyrus ussuriensis x Pyrus communis TaxID=2448454 RepID=A0A5N5FVG1_9ROSA|nr:LOB domain-containing protein 14-like [Pyrus ussuriensis x Pyrus communis]
MTGSGSPCGACKFLRRKCVRGCIFAPYFCHEQGATHFSAIHKVFGASNVSKLLAHLPVSDRCEAAMTISYEAQARLQDPIYGCVSHIFALQQQVVSLQAQLASLKDQAAQCFLNGSAVANPNEKFYGKAPSHTEEAHSWFHELENSSNPLPKLINSNDAGTTSYYENGMMNSYNSVNGSYENSMNIPDENVSSYGSFEEGTSHSMSSFDMQTNYNRQWGFQDADELQPVAFRYTDLHSR